MKETRSVEDRLDVLKAVVLALKDLDPDIQERILESAKVFLKLGNGHRGSTQGEG